MEVSCCSRPQTPTKFRGSSSLHFGHLYHIILLKRRPVMKVDNSCSRMSSEPSAVFQAVSSYWQLFSVLFLPYPPLVACISFLFSSIHLLLPPVLVICLLPGLLIAAFVTLTAVFLSLDYCLTSMAAALSLPVCHSAPSPILHLCPM